MNLNIIRIRIAARDAIALVVAGLGSRSADDIGTSSTGDELPRHAQEWVAIVIAPVVPTNWSDNVLNYRSLEDARLVRDRGLSMLS